MSENRVVGSIVSVLGCLALCFVLIAPASPVVAQAPTETPAAVPSPAQTDLPLASPQLTLSPSVSSTLTVTITATTPVTPSAFGSPEATVTVNATVLGAPTPTATAIGTPPLAKATCPAWFTFPPSGMGLLVIENHLGIETTIDAMRPLNWTKILAGKAGDVPDRLVLTLAPGHYEFVDHCVLHCRGIIKVDLLAGEMFVSPIWENDRTDEYVFPLTAPDGCSQ